MAAIPPSMRAMVHRWPGSPSKVLSLEDASVPSLPSETSVLVRVSHVALHPGTVIMMHLVPSLFRRFPAIAETDFSGVVVKTGSQVLTGPEPCTRHFPVGTPVFGSFQVPVHLRSGQGALGEYVAVDSSCVARVPNGVSYAEASALSVSLYTAITLVDSVKLPPKSAMLINAPCGGVGSFATQLLRHRYPEGRIVGICSEAKQSLAKELGCDEVVDYKSFSNSEHWSLTQYLKSRYGNESKFDAIFDAYGSQELWEACSGYLKSGRDHVYATVGPKVGCAYSAIPGFFWKVMKNTLLPSWLGGVPRTYRQISAFLDADALEKCREVVLDGAVKAHVGGVWELEKATLAYDQFTGGHAGGKLVIKVWEPEPPASDS
ncbi:predicted protein [Uncinocarpus reesii 1704]|uniref:Enoyl reductase (ER) domain-containing protein n=1 Tax=Uncinocarpus reesii (strain UAMH 1704) TaxID=336963 RepID=C4JUW3_UNCRE|nr:uncharacterized protein UREG_04916 [Uncinocarpus reesii 1704]EEP80074.1 predicted protein [Uncinocarpus reesii 1704]